MYAQTRLVFLLHAKNLAYLTSVFAAGGYLYPNNYIISGIKCLLWEQDIKIDITRYGDVN